MSASAFFSLLVVIGPSPAGALESKEIINQTLGKERGSEMSKQALNAALEAAKSKPSLAVHNYNNVLSVYTGL